MARLSLRTRIAADGLLEVIDPGIDTMSLLRAVDPGFEVRTAPLPGFEVPRLISARETPCGLSLHDLLEASDDELWRAHAAGVARNDGRRPIKQQAVASLLDVKIELAIRLLGPCRLCARQCHVDRRNGELGVCGLGQEGVVAEHFTHVAEEAPINPSMLIALGGCGLRCRFCQQWPLLKPARLNAAPLNETLWLQIDLTSARSLSFAGGNPDESLPSILRFLRGAPPDFSLPIVWNSHAYSTPEVLDLLDGCVDVFLPDLKYFNENCGRDLSGIPRYFETAAEAIATMVGRCTVIVRVLALPGHSECCHLPSIDFLSRINSEALFLSVRDQYCPDFLVSVADGELRGRLAHQEADMLRHYARQLGLQVI